MKKKKNNEQNSMPVKLTYPPEEDIYNREKRIEDINPDDSSKIKESNDEDGVMNEKSFDDELTGDDLDVPGSELDDDQEANGNEDEENNYYSLPDNK